MSFEVQSIRCTRKSGILGTWDVSSYQFGWEFQGGLGASTIPMQGCPRVYMESVLSTMLACWLFEDIHVTIGNTYVIPIVCDILRLSETLDGNPGQHSLIKHINSSSVSVHVAVLFMALGLHF